MKKQYVAIMFAFFLFVSICSAAARQNQQIDDDSIITAAGNTIYVNFNNTAGPWNGTYGHPYQHIRDGIMYASDGDTVYVLKGIYNETITINKSIYLRGQQQDLTIIDGQYNGTIIHIMKENVQLRRFTIRNSGGYPENAGILITAEKAMVTFCTLYRTRTGISIDNGSNSTIQNCRFYTNGYGIAVTLSPFITIDQCTFYHNGIGIYQNNSRCMTITNSYATTNGIGFLCSKSTIIDISHSAFCNNDDNEGGIFFTQCSYINIVECNLCHNGVGISLTQSSICFLDHCNISLNTHFACRIKESTRSILINGCLISENLRFGIYSDRSSLTLLWSNLFKNALYGLHANSSDIDARYNWWGSLTGPARTGLTRADRGTYDYRCIRYAPWLTFLLPETGSNWKTENYFQKPQNITPYPEQLHLFGNDTDGDGAPDWWEIKWGYNPNVKENQSRLDPDGDGLNNLEECYMDRYGASPFHKDVFLEFDWTKSLDANVTNKPPVTEINSMVAAFQKQNISLHVDVGNLSGGEEIPQQTFVSYAGLVDLYWQYFLHNDVNNPRQRIFHYGLICDTSEGAGFAFIGWDNLNSFAISAQLLAKTYLRYSRGWLAMTSAMHETGHTLGLIADRFGGIDNMGTQKISNKEFWVYIHYKSILNYCYTFSFMDFSDGSHGRGDFNDWGHLDFSFFKNTNFEYPR